MHQQRFYRDPLLTVLHGSGGSLPRPEALAAMADLLADVLTPDDRVPMHDRPAEEGWKNRTSWEVKDPKREGILVPTATAGRGVWMLSDLGLGVSQAVVSDQGPGTPYSTPPPPSPLSPMEPFDVVPDVVDRARTAHHDTVEARAQYVKTNGLTPLLPIPAGPQYDLAWLDGPILYVAEVKSTTDENEERQLRLGLGQVLRYRHLLSAKYSTIAAWLVPERQPSDPSWVELCDDLDVSLVWPPSFV